MTRFSLAAFAAGALLLAGVALADTAPDPIVQWYAYVCGDDGAVFKFLAKLLYPALAMAGASILANSKTVQAIPGLGLLVNLVAGNWRSWLRNAANKAPLILAVGFAGFLAACAQSTGTSSSGLASVQTKVSSGVDTLIAKGAAVVAKDTTAAEADAVAHADIIAEPCYPAINSWVQTLVPAPSASGAPQVDGLFSLQQKLRDLAATKPGASVVPATVKVACAALVIDDATFLAKFDAFIAAAVSSGGVSVVNSVLPVPLPASVAP